MQKVIDLIEEQKIIAIIRGISLADIVPTVVALCIGGIRLVEITFDHSSATGEKDAAHAIEQIKTHFDDKVLVGAGTVLNELQVQLAINSGACYIISPNVDPNVIHKTNEMGAISIPGAMTPTEIAEAYSLGGHFVKLFPAGCLGLEYIKAIRAPLSHVPLLLVGGVNDQNLESFLDTGICGVGIGSNIVDTKLIKEQRFNELSMLAKKYTEQVDNWNKNRNG